MMFEQAMARMRVGQRVARRAWSAHEFVCMQRGYPRGVQINAQTAAATGLPEGSLEHFRPYCMRRDHLGAFVPWTPSQEDLFTADWLVVHGTDAARREAVGAGGG